MKISVIIPTYKPKEYIWECLYSLVSQDFPKEDFEILIILNGCCEPYLSNIKKFITVEMTGFNVSIYQTDESGVSNARNIGLNKAKGKWIAFIDDDDMISATYLKELYKVSSHDTISMSNIKVFKEYDKFFFDNYMSNMYQKNKFKSHINLLNIRSFMSTSCCKLIPIEIIKNRKFDTKFTNVEDALFMFLISDRIKRFTFSEDSAIYYRRIRSDSALNNKTKSFLRKNKVKVLIQFFYIYFSSPFKYNFWFFMTRIAAVLFK
jgi:glycosyltransferase involved in cell wall biosynthesis